MRQAALSLDDYELGKQQGRYIDEGTSPSLPFEDTQFDKVAVD